MENSRREQVERIHSFLDGSDHAGLRDYATELGPTEMDIVFQELTNPERKAVLDLLDPALAAEIFGGLEDYVQEELAVLLDGRSLADLVEGLESDDATDLVRLLEPADQEQVLELVGGETGEEVRELLRHEEDTAGDLMMTELAAINEDALVAEVIENLREAQDEIRQLYNVFVVDSERRLLGHLSLRDMVLARPGMPMKALMKPVRVKAQPDMDQEEVALIFRRHDLVSLPVVDEGGRLVGRITVDDVMDVMEEEATEDISRLTGMGEDSFHPGSVLRVSRDRLPWLILGLLGGLLSGAILKGFDGTLVRFLELAFFVPVIMALAGNIGIQSSIIIVRGLATGEVRSGGAGHYILREAGVSLLNAVVIGAITFLVVFFWLGKPWLGGVVAGSMLSVVLWATLTGSLVPLILDRFKLDPAYATGPFVTTSNDIVALAIYMGIAWQFRHLLEI